MPLFTMTQMKLSSLVLAKEYMKRVARQLQSSEPSSQDGDFLIQGVRFAFRVHQVYYGLSGHKHLCLFNIIDINESKFQFAGGFNTDTLKAFEELKKIGISHQKS